MHSTVFGGSGRTGVPLVRQALASDHAVTASVRDPGKFPVAAGGLYVGAMPKVGAE